MDTVIQTLVFVISDGGPKAIIAILILFIILLIFDRRRLNEEIRNKGARIDKMIDDYYRGNITLAEALNSLKAVLYEIKSNF